MVDYVERNFLLFFVSARLWAVRKPWGEITDTLRYDGLQLQVQSGRLATIEIGEL